MNNNFGVQQSKNETLIAGSNATTFNAAAATTFLTYKHPTAGIKVQYPNNWSLIEYRSRIPSGNNTIVGFYLLPSKTASLQLGNISGVIWAFSFRMWIYIILGPRNKWLNEIVNERLDRIRNILGNLF